MIKVSILPEIARQIEATGRARNEHGKASGFTSLTKTQDPERENIIGRAGEWAVSHYYNLAMGQLLISKFETGRNAPSDVGSFIEVRTRSKAHYELGGFENSLKKDRAYVLCLAHEWPGAIYIRGWAWGYQILNLGQQLTMAHHKEVPMLALANKNLRSPESLFDVIRYVQRLDDCILDRKNLIGFPNKTII